LQRAPSPACAAAPRDKQRARAAGENEITAARALLATLTLGGALVTGDAIHAQAGTAQLVLDRGGDYLSALKANRPAMLEAVAAGVDIMDSIIPTKYAREGTVLTYRGRINLQKPNYARDRYPIDPNCTCYTCRSVTRGYLHHLFETTRSTAQAFAGLHNVAFCLRVMREAREAILDGRFDSYKAEIDRYYGRKG